MSGIFINYRRDESQGFAGRLAEALDNVFGADCVFRDIDDIRPGEDFVAAIDSRLQEVDVMLAVIGPLWLGGSKGGRRRLDDPEDFVRREIISALEAGKPVWPVLVGGAVMPPENDFPEPLRAIARHQAVVLSDLGWHDDVARLIKALQPLMLKPRRRIAWGWLAGGLALLGTLLLASPWLQKPLPSPVEVASLADGALSGHWRARLHYDWGAEHDEAFELKMADGEVHGTASYLGLPRLVEQGEQLAGGRLRFVTHTESVAGSTTRILTHRYRGQLHDEGIDFVLETSGGDSNMAPVEFRARRDTSSPKR